MGFLSLQGCPLSSWEVGKAEAAPRRLLAARTEQKQTPLDTSVSHWERLD